MLVIGIGINKASQSVDPALAIIGDGNTRARYNYLLGITKNGSNQISKWADALGGSDDYALFNGAADATKPVSEANYVSFNGSQTIGGVGGVPAVSPLSFYIVMNQVSWNSGRIFDGTTANQGTLFQYDSSPKLSLYEGAHIITSGALVPLNEFMIVRVVFDGASSSIQINNLSAVTGTLNAVNMTNVKLSSGTMVMQIKDFIIRTVNDNPSNSLAIYNYLKNLYSL
jgi:hypothetical protein